MIVAFWFLVVFGFSVLVGHSTLTLPFRNWLYSFKQLEGVVKFLECPMCTGGQVAFWTSFFYQPPFVFGHGRFVDATCAAFAAIAFNFLASKFTNIIGDD